MKRIRPLNCPGPLAILSVIGVFLLQPLTIARADFPVQIGAFADHDPAVRHAGQLFPVVSPAFVVAQQDAAGDPQSLDELFGDNAEAGDELFDESTTSSNTNYSGFFQSEYAYTYPSPDHSSKFRNILELRATGRMNEGAAWKISARGAYDAIFDLDNFYSSRVRDDRQFDGMLHETYLDISAGDFEFRLGRQHIIWGEMVGLFFADVVSAKDTRQFIAQDFDLIRLPQWAMRAEHFKGDFHTEVIWIPVMTYDEIGKPGDDFYPLSTTPPAGFDLIIENDDQPSQKLSNGAYGLRVSGLKSGWDLSGFYYSSIDATPAFFRTIEMLPTPTLVFEPRHDRIHQLGATLAKDFVSVLVKGEAIYTKDRFFNTTDMSDLDGVVRQDTLDYVIGLEKTLMDGTRLNFQLFQRHYTDHDSNILFDELESGISFYASKDLGSKMEAELLLVTGLNRSDWMARPKLTWDLSNNLWLAVGADIFGGDADAAFGRFDDSDRIYGHVRYAF